MGLTRVVIVTALATLATACGGAHHNHGAVAKPSATTCDPADDSCIPPDHPSSSPIPVPAAQIGQSIRYQAGGDNGAITQEITILKVKTAKSVPYPDQDYTARPQAGHIYLCLDIKLRNVGTTPGDAYLGAQWFGLDGKTEEAATALMVGCDGLGMKDDDLTGQPDPQPGKYVTGTAIYQLPEAPGALEVTDRDGTPLLRVNYGPRSAQVPIDARGQ
jgi:hypothetical protein